MLVLSRKINEKIYIGENIVITLLEIQGPYKARLGIEAPANVSIEREEVRAQRLKQEQENQK